MIRIIADISGSLDGFVAGSGPSPDNGLGTGGEALHTWAFPDDPDDRRVLREAAARSGAVVLGRHLFDVVDGPNGWDDTTGYGAGEAGKPASVPGARRRAGRRADGAPRAHRAGRRDTTVHRRSAAHAGAAERDLGIDRDAPDLRRLPVIR
jgi:hypothetical protein